MELHSLAYRFKKMNIVHGQIIHRFFTRKVQDMLLFVLYIRRNHSMEFISVAMVAVQTGHQDEISMH